MKTKSWAIGLIILCTLFTSSAQVFYKFGAAKLVLTDIMTIITNYNIFIGLFLYGISAFLMLLAFKGGEVTVLYPIFATSFIWVAILSNIFFSEPLNLFKWLGVGSIIIGISFISYGSKLSDKKTRTKVSS